MTPMRANIVGPPDVRDQDQRLHGCLLFLRLVLGLGKSRDVFARALEGDEAATARQRLPSGRPSEENGRLAILSMAPAKS
jgi:hypothetical protein